MMKGPTFCPSTTGTYLDAKAELTEYTRKLKIREKYHDCTFTSGALVKEKNKHYVTCTNNELKRIVEHIENIAPTKIQLEKNITPEETHALTSLKSHDDIVIKKADKGGMFVILSKNFYRDKMVLHDHLNTNTYEKVNDNADKKVMECLEEHLKRHSKCLHESEINYIKTKNGNQATCM